MSGLNEEVRVINVGLESFYNDLKSFNVPVIQTEWRPPAFGDMENIACLIKMRGPKIENANIRTVERLIKSRPVWVDVGRAGEVITNFRPNHILHSGPPIDYSNMSDPQQRAVEGAAIFEGLAKSRKDFLRKVREKKIILKPNYQMGSIGPMCGVITASMSVIITKNAVYKNSAWSTFNEGKGNVLWMGTYDDDAIKRLIWMRDVLGPGLKAAIKQSKEGIDIFNIIAEGIQMGDEVHARSAACTSLLLRKLYPLLLKTGLTKKTIFEITDFIDSNNHFFLNFTLTACKVTADAAHGVKYSTVVTAMSRNGVEFALRVGGIKDKWFISKTAPMDEAIYYSGYGPKDAAGDIGDSAIVETTGLGGMIIGAAPTVASFVGGSMSRMLSSMKNMQSICVGKNPRFGPASMDFMPGPLGIDVRKVLQTGTMPIIDTGVLHKSSGVGQIGAGIARAPREAFVKALHYMEKHYG